MRRGTCTKCGQAQVRCARGGMYWHGASTTGDARLRTSSQPPMTEVNGAVDTYLCTACGYFEQYVASPEALATVAATWSYLPPQ